MNLVNVARTCTWANRRPLDEVWLWFSMHFVHLGLIATTVYGLAFIWILQMYFILYSFFEMARVILLTMFVNRHKPPIKFWSFTLIKIACSVRTLSV